MNNKKIKLMPVGITLPAVVFTGIMIGMSVFSYALQARAQSVAPTLSIVGISPNSGTTTAFQSNNITFKEGSGATDLVLAGACSVNNVDVSSTFASLGFGFYKTVYTVGTTDTERMAGQIPINCILGNSNGTVTASTWSGLNTLAVDTNNDGIIGVPATTTATTTSPFATTTTPSIVSVSLIPSVGILHPGDLLRAYFQESSNMTDLVLNGICRINNVDISPLDTLSSGSYRLNYTIGLNDTSRAAGMVPIVCNVVNGAGATTSFSAFTDNNTLAIDTGIANATTSTSTGSLGGTVNTGPDAPLAITSITQTATTTTAGSGFAQGWIWTFHITVPNTEVLLSMKFANWIGSIGSSTIPSSNNMRISSAQAASTSTVMITGAGMYSDPLPLNADLDANTPGRQIDVRVEMQVPAGTANGSYSTDYGVKSN
jgi:hypothetical protein